VTRERVANRGGVEGRFVAEEVSAMKKSQVIVGMWVLWMAVAAFIPASVSVGTAPANGPAPTGGTVPTGGAGPAGGTAGVDEELTLPKLIQSCRVLPVYPEQEKVAGTEGTVLLGVEVKADGTIANVKAEQEIKDHPAFTASAITAVGKWCFEPARKDGRAVACTVTIPVRFVLDEKKELKEKK
jgi:periplasmic protein TonB